MAKLDYYTFLSDKRDTNHFECYVVDKDYNYVKTYHVYNSTCDCWAGHKWCRHKKMLVIFKRDNKIDSREYYNFDKEVWLPKPKGAEQ